MKFFLLAAAVSGGVFLGLWAFARWAARAGGAMPVGFGGAAR